jgi:cytochrome c55X
VLFVFVILSQISAAAPADSTVGIDPVRQDELVHLLRQDCGSCHGMTLKGGLGPALTPEVMAARPVEYLYHTVREGHAGTPMPPWRGILTDDEIMWLVTRLQNGLPKQ